MTVKISATFKKSERDSNGLDAIGQNLIDDPLTRYLAVVLVETTKVVRDIAEDVETPHTRVVVIEPMVTAESQKAARELLDDAHKARLGRVVQPTLFDDTDGE